MKMIKAVGILLLAVLTLAFCGCNSENSSIIRLEESSKYSQSSYGTTYDSHFNPDSASSSNESIAPNDYFTETYGNLPTYKDVRNNPALYEGKEFMLSGTAILSDYYDAYDYSGLESICFCIRVIPTGGDSADQWYVYARSGNYRGLHKKLGNGPVEVNMVCQSASTGLSHGQAGLNDYFLVSNVDSSVTQNQSEFDVYADPGAEIIQYDPESGKVVYKITCQYCGEQEVAVLGGFTRDDECSIKSTCQNPDCCKTQTITIHRKIGE